jgi:hypothetical protein
MSTGEKMSSLPYIEIKVVPDEPVEARIRGTAPADVQKLLDTFRGLRPQGATPRAKGLLR